MGRDDFERARARNGQDHAPARGSDAFKAAATSLQRAFGPVVADSGFDELLAQLDSHTGR